MTFTIESMGKRRIKRIKISVNEKGIDVVDSQSAAGGNGSSDNVVYSWLLIAALFFCGCDEDYTPRPKGYFRLEFPEKKYERAEMGNCPYTFEVPVYSKLLPDTSKTAEPCWFNLEFPKLNATTYLSYKKVDNNIAAL